MRWTLYRSPNSLLPACRGSIRGDDLVHNPYFKTLSFLAAVFLAERNDVPAAISRIVSLHECAHDVFLNARVDSAVGDGLAAEFSPVVQPAAARATVQTGSVDIRDLHSGFLSDSP